jgi:tol-pal system protein YbgF
MMRSLLVILAFISLLLGACASKSDLEAIQRDTNSLQKDILALQRNVGELNQATKDVMGKIDAQGSKTEEIRREIGDTESKIQSKIAVYETALQPMRRSQADLGDRLEKLQVDVQHLMGRYEESKYFAQKSLGESKTLRESYQIKIDEFEKQVAALKQTVEDLEVRAAGDEETAEGKKTEKPAVAEAEPEKEPASAKKPEKLEKPGKPEKASKPEKQVAALSPDEAYKKAYDQFSKGDIEGAKNGFKQFLESYPKSKYAENAHFWLGECYFSEKKYEEAILEYDEVIKKFPKGSKVPNALFRQGMAFLAMEDTTNAKLIFKEVIKRFPKTEQAKIAQKKLKEI